MIESTIILEGYTMHVIYPIGKRCVQIKVVFPEIRPQTNKPATQEKRKIIRKKEFRPSEKTPSHPVIAKADSHIVTYVTEPQTGKRPEHTILENILVVMIDVIQTDAEGGVIGSVVLHLSITEAKDEVGGITSETVCTKLKQSALEIIALPSVDQGISETKIIFAQSGFGTQGEGRDKNQNESKKSKFHMQARVGEIDL